MEPALGLDPRDERCFLPIHVYDTATSRPVAVLLRPGKTPSGVEVRGHLRRLVRRIRVRWPKTRILMRGDSHYARPEAMEWCEANGVDYVFGLAGSKPLESKVEPTADAVRTERAIAGKAAVVRSYAETRHRAGSWNRERHVVARIEATPLGLDVRFVVTNLAHATAELATLRLRLLKVAARVIETASRVRIAFAAACPEADLFRSMPGALWPSAP